MSSLFFRSTLVLVLFAVPAFAGADEVEADLPPGSCHDCVRRKQVMCARECELVPADKARRCQQRCIAEYCSHRCRAGAPELKEFLAMDCDGCLEQQFDLCDQHCAVGTARARALCRVGCSEERCRETCAGQEQRTESKSGADKR